MGTDAKTYRAVVAGITTELGRLATDEERVALLMGAMFTIFHARSHEVEGDSP